MFNGIGDLIKVVERLDAKFLQMSSKNWNTLQKLLLHICAGMKWGSLGKFYA